MTQNTVSQVAGHLLQTEPAKLITVSLTEDNKITLQSAGDLDSATAVVMLGNALAVVYSELPEQVRNNTTVAQFLNNLNAVTINRVQMMHPEVFNAVQAEEPSMPETDFPMDAPVAPIKRTRTRKAKPAKDESK